MESTIPSKNRWLTIAILFVLSFTIFSSSTYLLGGFIGNALAFTSYIIFIGVFAYIFRKHNYGNFVVLTFFVIFELFLINYIRRATGLIDLPPVLASTETSLQQILQFVDVIAYIVGPILMVLFLPRILDKHKFMAFICFVSSASVLVGLPAYLIGDYSILQFRVETYTTLEPFRWYGINIPALSSVWDDANAMSKITGAGIFASHYLYLSNKTKFWKVIMSLNVFGLALANSKMAIIAVIISYSVYFMYSIFGIQFLYKYIGVAGSIGLVGFVLILAGFGKSIVSAVGFTQRVHLWQSSWYTFLQHPIIGVGIQDVGKVIASYTTASVGAPQNSYLRILVSSGVIGGLLYFSLIGQTVFGYISRIKSKQNAVMFSLFLTFTLVQFTDTADPFGINKNALIFGSSLGYLLKEIHLAEE